MKFALIFCLLAVVLSMAQRQSVIVLPSIADSRANLKPEELELLTENVRSIISDVLPLKDFNLLKQDVVRERLGDEALFIACKEGTCVGELVAMAQADFGARCDIVSVNKQLYLKFELYGTLRGERESGTIAQFTEPVKNFTDMRALIAKRIPAAIQRMIIEPAPTKTQVPVKQATPTSAPVVKAPVIENTSYYISGGSDDWGLTIDGKHSSLNKIRLPLGTYEAKLTHECYEDIDFNAEIKQGEYEIFDISNEKLHPKKGNLFLRATKNSEVISEPVFVNGELAGTTPFDGFLPICSEIEIGENKKKVKVKLKEGETVEYTHKELKIPWGFVIGYGFPSFNGLKDKEYDFRGNVVKEYNYEGDFGFYLGLATLWPIISNIDLEVNFLGSLNEAVPPDGGNGPGYLFAELPLFLRYYFGSFYSGAGARIGLTFPSEKASGHIESGGYNAFDLSLMLGGGVQLGGFFLGAKYFVPVTSFGEFYDSSASRGGLFFETGYLF